MSSSTWAPTGTRRCGWGVRARNITILLTALACCDAAVAQVTLTEGSDINVDVSTDGRIVMDLLGGIWVLPRKGGNASRIDAKLLPAERPR